jgi:L-ascorbate metabolism protein UlaG (beta-lactamase superfamily)
MFVLKGIPMPTRHPGRLLCATLAGALVFGLGLSGCATPAAGPAAPAAAAAAPSVWPVLPQPPNPAGVQVIWLGQAAFKITTPGGKVIVTDPWLRTNPLTPAAYKSLDAFGKIDVLLVSHGHFDHIADAPALAQQYNVPIRAPGDLANTAMTLGVLPAALLPRMNKGGTIEPVPGVKVTAVRAEHSSVYVWRNPATQKDETHPGGEAVGWIIELENGFRIYHAGDTAVFGDMQLIGQRYQPHLALVPIGGNFTMDPSDAATAVKAWLKPQVVVPMHYGANPLAKGTPAQFKAAMGDSPVRVLVAQPGEVLNF